MNLKELLEFFLQKYGRLFFHELRKILFDDRLLKQKENVDDEISFLSKHLKRYTKNQVENFIKYSLNICSHRIN